MAGWIKLNRQITDHWLWSEEAFTKAQAWIDLLLHANHKPARITIKGQLIKLEAGQQARSEITLSKDWRWSKGKVRRFLQMLKNERMIVQQTNHLTSIITVSNYRAYQQSKDVSGTPNDTADDTTGSTNNGQLTVHSEECKKERSILPGETDSPPSSPPNCPHQEIIDAYHRHLPTLRRVKVWSDARKKHLKSRWRESEKHQTIEFWNDLFLYISQSSFLMDNQKNQFFDLEWIIKPANFIKIVEGKYHNG